MSKDNARFKNSNVSFGSVTKTLHWLTAILIFLMIVLGVVAGKWPYDTSDALATKALLFSIHKTLGLVTFLVALMRIFWAFTQPRPASLPSSKPQHIAAETVHWLLYASLIIVPLTGWAHHAATTGFAPIWWPFGQTLPFVPKTEEAALLFRKFHFLFNIILGVSILLHIAGALKHHLIDHDATLKRMLPGAFDASKELPESTSKEKRTLMPFLAAGLVIAIAASIAIVREPKIDKPIVPALSAISSQWDVTEGTLSIAVQQLDQKTQGAFANWTASIDFDEKVKDGEYGNISVEIAIASLTLGSMTPDALSKDFLNADAFATAKYSGPILAEGENYYVDGVLTLLGQSKPLLLPFTLKLEGDIAKASGSAILDRRDFGIGVNYPNESSVGFNVEITFDLTANRNAN